MYSPLVAAVFCSGGLRPSHYFKVRGDATPYRQTNATVRDRRYKWPRAVATTFVGALISLIGGFAFAAEKQPAPPGLAQARGPETDKRLYPVSEVGTDPHRAILFTEKQAERFNKFLAELVAAGYEAPKEFSVRSTGKYWGEFEWSVGTVSLPA